MTRQSPRAPKKSAFRARLETFLGSTGEADAFFGAMNRLATSPRKALRLNPRREGGEAWMAEHFPELGPAFAWEPRSREIPAEALFKKLTRHPAQGAGLFYIQEPGAMEAVAFLDPRPGERVLDLCAAPGGKSTQIAERLAGEGWLVANEFVRARASTLDWLLARHGAANVTVTSLDPAELAKSRRAAFDAILVDAPCSGESLFAKRIEQRGDVSDNEVRGCARRQSEILDAAAALLRPGGRIVYSTCTYSREENEDVVRDFVARGEGRFGLEIESRRWPHRDGIPGGYAALLRCLEPAREAAGSLASPPEHGLIRHGLTRWDGEVDLYAAAMSGAPFEVPDLEIDERQAERWLRGEGFSGLPRASESQVRRVTWRNWPLGHGRAVEDRINNLLPKALRLT